MWEKIHYGGRIHIGTRKVISHVMFHANPTKQHEVSDELHRLFAVAGDAHESKEAVQKFRDAVLDYVKKHPRNFKEGPELLSEYPE